MRYMASLTERDLTILEYIYKHRTLTTQQIHKMFFDNRESRAYTHRKMYLFRKIGYIISKPIVNEDGKKMTSAYFLTEQGIDLLVKNDIVNEAHAYRARDNELEGYQLKYQAEVNDVLADLFVKGWGMIDSRSVKRDYHLNRTSLIQGILYHKNRNYGLYYVKDRPQKSTINRMILEIKQLKGIQEVYVLFKNGEGLNMFYSGLKNKQDGINLPLHLLPVPLGVYLLTTIGIEHNIVKLFTKYGLVTPIDSSIARYKVNQKGEDVLITEIISNTVTLQKELESYTPKIYMEKKQKVLVLCWRNQLDKLRNDFKDYHHITFEAIEREELEQL